MCVCGRDWSTPEHTFLSFPFAFQSDPWSFLTVHCWQSPLLVFASRHSCAVATFQTPPPRPQMFSSRLPGEHRSGAGYGLTPQKFVFIFIQKKDAFCTVLIAGLVVLLAQLPRWHISAIDPVLFHMASALREDGRHVSVWMGEGGMRGGGRGGRESRSRTCQPEKLRGSLSSVTPLLLLLLGVKKKKKGRTKDSPCCGSAPPLMGKLSSDHSWRNAVYMNHVKENNKHYLSSRTVTSKKKAARLEAFTQFSRFFFFFFCSRSLGFIHLFFPASLLCWRVSISEGTDVAVAYLLKRLLWILTVGRLHRSRRRERARYRLRSVATENMWLNHAEQLSTLGFL